MTDVGSDGAAAPLVVLYGGTFDPVHEGHLAIARDAHAALGVPVRLMPAADPPHRPPPGADASHRAAMLALAIEGEPGLALDLRELGRDTPSWTAVTLRELRAELGSQVPVALLVGADSFHGLPTWRDWEALFELAHFVVADRAGSPLSRAALPAALARRIGGRVVDDPRALRDAPAGRVLFLAQPLRPGSATDIRGRLARGEALDGAVPAPVAAYIARNGLYRAAVGGPGAVTTPPL
jgi:nicotinate-nucleotide adenylyltransferase